VTLACTIYEESPCHSALSSVIKSCHNDADGKSKDYSDGNCPDPVDSIPEACIPTHEDPAISALAHFDAHDFVDEENSPDQ